MIKASLSGFLVAQGVLRNRLRTYSYKGCKMVFACQNDSYKTEYTTEVVSCNQSSNAANAELRKKEYEVVLNNTILFPEGGGQPSDKGMINDVPVIRVLRRGGTAVHIVGTVIPEGIVANVKVDWNRRFDHMQQHTGQHLLSAIIENNYGFKTLSWELGRTKTEIDLDCSTLTQIQMNEIEEQCNKAIRDHLKVNVHVYDSVNDPELQHSHTRGLPDDHVGKVRVIEIEGIDMNMCCGTHLRNLSDLQMIKLLNSEPYKGGTRLFFLAGARVLDFTQKALDNEKGLTKILSCGPDEHVLMVDKLQKSLKVSNKINRSQLRELAQLESYKIKSTDKKEPYLCIHRDDGDMEYMNTIANELKDENIFLFLTCGPAKGQGQFLLCGPETLVTQLSSKVAELLDGKGGGRKGRFQGKANKLSGRKNVEKLLQDHFTDSLCQ